MNTNKRTYKVVAQAHFEYLVEASDEEEAIQAAVEHFDDEVGAFCQSAADVLTWEAEA